MIYHYNTSQISDKLYQPESVVLLIYGDRMRTLSDKQCVQNIFESVFERKVRGNSPVVYLNADSVFLGDIRIARKSSGVNANVLKQDKSCLVLRSQLGVLRSLAYCVNLNWMAILVSTKKITVFLLFCKVVV